MTFEEVLNQASQMLQRQGRVSFRALQRQFNLDDAYLKDLIFEMVEVRKVAVVQDQSMLVWSNPFLASDAERRQLTVMFCDLVDSTQLAESLDPEDLREVFLAYQKVCAKAIASSEGYIAQYLGDGVLIYFGYPQAHEDDARRAVSSGLRILEAIKRLNPQIEKDWGVTLSIRIGIHTGLVIAGEMGVREAPSPMAVVGETTNVAARLQSIADPNTLIISAATHRLIEGFFECSMIGRRPLKGISEPMLVYQVRHESTAKNRFEVAEKSGLTPFVNRKAERAFLLKNWEDARAGRSHAILLQGEAGMGKSRMVWELKKHIAQEPDAWLTELQGSPYYRNSAFYPVIELFQKFTFQFKREDTPVEKLAKIESFLIQYTLDLEQYVPLFASLLSIPFESKYDALNLPPERQKQKTIEALGTILLLLSLQQPVLFVIEDLHWMDASTLDVISYILNQAADHRLLTLLTFRPEFISPWDALPHVLSLDLKHLPDPETTAIVEQTAQGKSLPQEVVRQIVQKTDGIPLFVEELTKSVLESNLLQENETSYTLTGSLPILSIPATLHDSLIARLDRLAMVKEIAQFCATLSREFEYGLLVAISPWDAMTLQNGLSQLVEAGLLYQHGTVPNATYQFKHALIQDAAYQSLLRGRRQQYHQRIAEALEGLSARSATTQPELLAHHFTEAGLFDKAIYYWHKAGQRDLEQAANVEAITHLKKAIQLLTSQPDDAKRKALELTLQMLLGPAMMAIKGYSAPEVRDIYGRARELSGQVTDSPQLFPISWGLWAHYFVTGDLGSARAVGEQLVKVAHQSSDSKLVVPANHALGYVECYLGHYERTVALTEEAFTLFDIEQERCNILQFQFSSTLALYDMARTSLWMLGELGRASEMNARALQLAKELAHPPSMAYAVASSVWFLQLGREINRIHEAVDTVTRISNEEEFSLWPPLVRVFQGWALVEQGLVDQGLALMHQNIKNFHALGGGILQTHAYVLLTEALVRAGQNTEALATIEQAVQRLQTSGEHHMEPELYRLRGEILLDLSRSTNDPNLAVEGENSLRHALDLATGQNSKWLQLKSATSLAQLFCDQEKPIEAHQILIVPYGRMSQEIETLEMQRARVILDHLVSLV
ncbi:MAG: adenylate/guanylate cyclase domain-containing protein [Thermosynechococcaceae cyanobacterium]